jgi:hypothetical protein
MSYKMSQKQFEAYTTKQYKNDKPIKDKSDLIYFINKTYGLNQVITDLIIY